MFSMDPATTHPYTLSLHDALPICAQSQLAGVVRAPAPEAAVRCRGDRVRRSEEHTLNSSHVSISYAVFCLKKKNEPEAHDPRADVARHDRLHLAVGDPVADRPAGV